MNLKKTLPYFILTVAVFGAYFNCLNNEFIWDDEFLIEKNSYLRSFAHVPKILTSNSTAGFGGIDNFYRPTQNLYYLIIYQAFGYDKVAFHLGNILLHVLNSLLLFLVMLRLFDSRSWAFATSLLWALHPTHVEAIGYISGTADPMGLLFFLLALWVLPFSQIKKKWKNLVLAWLFFTLSLLSKEAMIVIPSLLMIVYALVSPKGRWHWRTYLPTIPFWITAAVYMLLRKTVLNFNETYNFYKDSNIYTENIIYRLYTYLATLPEYLKILFYPVNLHMERDFPVFTSLTATPVILGGTIVASSLGLCLWSYKKRRQTWPLFSWFWFFMAFVPMMGILVPVNSFILEHWLYLPSIGLFIVFGKFIDLAFKSRAQFGKGLAGITMAFSSFGLIAFTHIRNQDWKTPITFYNNIVKYGEGSARVHNNLAMAYSAKKDYQKGITHYLKAIELSDQYAQTHYNLARAYIQIQKYNEAKLHLQRSLEINPNFSYAIQLKRQLHDFLRAQKSSR